MNFDAVQVDVNEILSVNRRYVIPRNQREFSWEKLQLDEFWDDVRRNISFSSEEQKFQYTEYFLGTIVLSGSSDSALMEIIDGQQRLSVLTLIVSIISRKLRAEGYDESADTLFDTYIVTKSSLISVKNSLKEKIEKTNGRDFFKLKCQAKNDEQPDIKTEEDEKIEYAYKYFDRKLSKTSACQLLNRSKVGVKYSKEEYILCLEAILKMITSYLKVVRILVPSSEDAYDIFEVLNARGISLSSVDLIKNKVLQYCTEEYPQDKAKKSWYEIEDMLLEIDKNISMTDYIRTWWMTKYGYVGEEQLYRAFKKKILDDKSNLDPKNFIENLRKDADLFYKVSAPQPQDWPLLAQKPIFSALSNLHSFGISVHRPMVFSLLRIREDQNKKKFFSQTDLIEILNFIEHFHFKFNSICKMKPSGIDSMYAKYATEVSNAKDKLEIKAVIDDFKNVFSSKMPNESIFIEKFCTTLWYGKSAADKKKRSSQGLINYVFNKLESINRNSSEVIAYETNLEHIGSQSNFDEATLGMIGNLIPLSVKLNDQCKNLPVAQKIKFYNQSDLKNVEEFLIYYRSYNDWTPTQVQERSRILGLKLFNNMYK